MATDEERKKLAMPPSPTALPQFRPSQAMSLQRPTAPTTIPPGKQGMTHMPANPGMERFLQLRADMKAFGGVDPRAKYPTNPAAPSGGVGGMTAPPPPPPASTKMLPPDGTTTEEMLAEQNAGFDAPTVGQDIPEDVMNLGSPYGMNGTLYANATPPKGYGNVIYSDSAEGAKGGFGGKPLIKPHGFGPFGRTMEQQKAIMDRVGEYNRATEMYKSMRGATETQRNRRALEQQANANVSLDQGLSSFLTQAANRNYARDTLKQERENDTAAATAATAQANKDRDYALDLARLQKPEFKAVEIPTGEVDLYGKPVMREVLVNPMTGEKIDPMQMPGEATAGASRVAPPEAVAALKEDLRTAKDEKQRQAFLDEFEKDFDRPEGI